MPELVKVREDLGVIQVDSFGEVTEQDLMESLNIVLDIHKERGFSKVFVDATRETSLPQTISLFSFGSILARKGIPRGIRIAVAVSEKTTEALRFIETVTQNRGFQCRMYDSSEAALDWLLK